MPDCMIGALKVKFVYHAIIKRCYTQMFLYATVQIRGKEVLPCIYSCRVFPQLNQIRVQMDVLKLYARMAVFMKIWTVFVLTERV